MHVYVCICYCCWPERAVVSVPRYSLSGIFKYSRPVSPAAIPPLPPPTPPSPNRVRSPTQRPRPTFAVHRHWTRVYMCVYFFFPRRVRRRSDCQTLVCFRDRKNLLFVTLTECTHTHTRTLLLFLFSVPAAVFGGKISLTKKKNSLKIATTRRQTRLVP